LLVGATTGDPARQVANAHTIYNVTASLVALPFCPSFARLLARLLPDRSILF
jgi:phosphate:Na+ symporter